jgi:hypothetical protein
LWRGFLESEGQRLASVQKLFLRVLRLFAAIHSRNIPIVRRLQFRHDSRMSTRSLLLVTAVSGAIATLAISPAMAGLISKDDQKAGTAASTQQQPAKSTDVEAPRSVPAAEKSGASDSAKPPRDNKLGDEKSMLGKLVKELQHSPRSFLYLRSIGYTQSDQDFEEIINKNNAVFRRTRIVRRDDQGVRQIPGWPGITLTDEYKKKR